MIDVDVIRAQIPTTRNCVCLNTGWSGPSPQPVTQAIIDGLPWESEQGSVTMPCYYLRERHGIPLRFVHLGQDDTKESLLTKFAEALENGHPRLIFLSHVSYANGMRLPLEEICGLAHERGTLVLMDGAQAAGHIALNLRELSVAFFNTDEEVQRVANLIEDVSKRGATDDFCAARAVQRLVIKEL